MNKKLNHGRAGKELGGRFKFLSSIDILDPLNAVICIDVYAKVF